MPLRRPAAAAITLLLAPLCWGQPAAPGTVQGGAPCSLDSDCGWLPFGFSEGAASPSQTGSCVNGRCVCIQGYACARCTAELQFPAENTLVHPVPGGVVDLCVMGIGGGYCTDLTQCYGGGACVSNRCVCSPRVICPFCTLDIAQDLTALGANCSSYIVGYAACTDSSTCGHGICTAGRCQCQSGFACPDCSQSKKLLMSGQAQCVNRCPSGCGSGTCSSGGVCQCPAPWGGASCAVNVCAGLNCAPNGQCANGQCECDVGYGGLTCDILSPINGNNSDSCDPNSTSFNGTDSSCLNRTHPSPSPAPGGSSIVWIYALCIALGALACPLIAMLLLRWGRTLGFCQRNQDAPLAPGSPTSSNSCSATPQNPGADWDTTLTMEVGEAHATSPPPTAAPRPPGPDLQYDVPEAPDTPDASKAPNVPDAPDAPDPPDGAAEAEEDGAELLTAPDKASASPNFTPRSPPVTP